MILLTGGSGVLGQELLKEINCFAPDRSYLDITKPTFFDALGPIPSLIIHCAAYTDVLKAETEKELCYQTNVIGTRNLARTGIPMLYLSTEYVFDGEKGNYAETDYPNPKNFYAFTKLLGEYECRRTRSVVIRCLFKPRPFEHDRACTDQFTSGDYVDIMGKEICLVIGLFDQLPQTLHLGFKKKSTFELARQSKPEVIPCRLDEISTRLPRNTTLDTRTWQRIKGESKLRSM